MYIVFHANGTLYSSCLPRDTTSSFFVLQFIDVWRSVWDPHPADLSGSFDIQLHEITKKRNRCEVVVHGYMQLRVVESFLNNLHQMDDDIGWWSEVVLRCSFLRRSWIWAKLVHVATLTRNHPRLEANADRLSSNELFWGMLSEIRNNAFIHTKVLCCWPVFQERFIQWFQQNM